MKLGIAILIAVTALVAAAAAPAASVAAKPCGTVHGTAARGSGLSFSQYRVFAISADCGFAKSTTLSVLRQHLPNSKTPVRAKAPGGWVCVAQEVDGHVAVAGHCQRGHGAAFAWVGVGYHP